MSNRIVKFDNEVREKIKHGVSILSNAVKTTMGPRGKTVLIEREGMHPIVTKDGVTVAKAINLSDKFANLGVQVVKDAASRSAEEAGDGTTTATVLAQSFYENGLRLLASGEDAVNIRTSLEDAVTKLIIKLNEIAKPIETDKELFQIALVSCNNELKTAQLITDAIKKVGRDGSIIVEEAKGYKSDLTFVEGVQIDRGYLSPYFITDQDKMISALQDSYVLLVNKKIDNIKEIIKPLEIALEQSKSILIVANDFDNEALQGLVVNKIKGNLKVCAIKSPGFGDTRYDLLQDISVVTGSKVFDYSDDMSMIEPEDLGQCKKIIVGRSSTLFVSDNTREDLIQKRLTSLRNKLEIVGLENNEMEVIKYRLERLSGGVAILRVGAATEAEMIERRDRVDDALSATKAALQEGTLPGGGVALIRASADLHIDTNDEVGYAILKRACSAPLRQIVTNCGKSADLVIETIKNNNDVNFGYDSRSEQFGNMYEMGIIDPCKVVRSAVQNACSAAVLLLTSDCAMVNEN